MSVGNKAEMSVTIKLNPILKEFANGQEIVEVIGYTTGECLEDLESKFPAIKKEIRDNRGNLASYYLIYVNQKVAYPEELTTPVKNGDEIEFGVVITGG